MTVETVLEPFPQHAAFAPIRDSLKQVMSKHSDREVMDMFEKRAREMRNEFKEIEKLLGQSRPTNPGKVERFKKSGLQAQDLMEVIVWYDTSIEKIRAHLRSRRK